MGLLKRLFGGSPAPAEQLTHVRQATFDHTRGDASVEVVGEQYYPGNVEAFRRFAKGRSERAMLMLDPTNEYDSNAVAVLAWVAAEPTPQAGKVGHLQREDAAAYRPVFDYLEGVVIGCDAAIAPFRGGRGTDGVVLNLGTPGELIAEIWAERHPFGEHPYQDKSVVFTGFGLSLVNVTLDRPGQQLLARLAGVVVAPRMTKKVDACIRHGHEETTSTAKARDYGIPVVDELEFWTQLGIPSTELSKGVGRWAQPRGRAWTP